MNTRESMASVRTVATYLPLSASAAAGERNLAAESVHPTKAPAMTIGKFCNRNVVCATRDTTVVEAATLMRHHHVGDLIVVDQTDGRRTPIGVVTDRDVVVEVVAPGLDPKGIKLGDLLVGRLVTVEEDRSRSDAVRLMATSGVRRMPVVDTAGRLVGIVTLDDLLPHVAGQLTDLSELVRRSRQLEVETRK
jgi:CBS domain-containing protein